MHARALKAACAGAGSGRPAPVVHVNGEPVYTSTTSDQTVNMPPSAIDLSAIPLGNGKYNRTTP